jgi:excisionase family DNA binding protein
MKEFKEADKTDVLKELEEIKNLTLLGAKTALNVNDLALLTGLSKSTIYKFVMEKRIPYYKNAGGKLTYFDRQEIEKWLLFKRVPTIEEAEQEAIKYCVANKKGGLK